jgi:hypothetical protein
LLKIKDETNEIDILKISQVVTIVSGIYIAYKQYYNRQEDFYNVCLLATDNRPVFEDSNGSRKRRKNVIFRPAKKIYFH